MLGLKRPLSRKTVVILTFVLLFIITGFVVSLIYTQDLSNESTRAGENTPSVLSIADCVFEIDQNDTYISLSSNDVSGYNRWIPFYFTLSTNSDYTETEVTDCLKKTFTGATISSHQAGDLFTTDTLVWSVFEINGTSFNPSLVIIPEVNELRADSPMQIDRITLFADTERFEFDLSDFVIQTKTTVSESEFYVASSTMETTIQDNLQATVEYAIAEKGAIMQNDSMDLEYPPGFATIQTHEKTVSEREKDDEYQLDITRSTFSISFQERRDKVVFRPFLKINDNDQTVFLIPSLPAYINAKEASID